MKLTKENRGITLVALIVTIIILLILVGISIASLTGSGLFEKAKLAKEKQENAQIEEATKIGDYENEISEYINGTRNNNNSNNYSTEEMQIGTWIDGKPIYRKVVYFGSLPNATQKSVSSGIVNMDNLVNLWGTSYRSTDKARRILPYNYTSQESEISLYLEDTTIEIITGIDRSKETAYIYIEYTKTTDTAVNN